MHEAEAFIEIFKTTNVSYGHVSTMHMQLFQQMRVQIGTT